MCRTDDCNWDDGDCQSEDSCSGNCNNVYVTWSVATTDGQNKLNITEFCIHWWPLFALQFDIPDEIVNNCTGYVNSRDYSNDSHLNFREATAVMFPILLASPNDPEAGQVNCSACVGMESYNV